MLTPFTGEQLRNTVSFDPDKRLRGDPGSALLEEVLGLLADKETRGKARKPNDTERHNLTVSCLLANLAAAAKNRVDPTRFVIVSFNRNDYAKWGLSVTSMTAMRDVLLDLKMIEGRNGVRQIGRYDEVRGSLTRLRATPDLTDIFEQHEIGYASIVRLIDRGAVILKERLPDVSSIPPEDVAVSEPIIHRVNSLIARAVIDLPNDAWGRVVTRHAASATKDKKERGDAGDLTANSLFRSFKYDWKRGGRLYGGWWMGLPKEERPYLTINGEQTVELDYDQFHPSILFARIGRPLDFPLYSLPDLEVPGLRQVGKHTFMVLLNSDASNRKPGMMTMPAKYRKLLPKGLPPEEYMRRLYDRMEPISKWFSTGEGIRLQRADSDLAVSILAAMEALDIVTLPVHDSFIVQERHRQTLRDAMSSCYMKHFGQRPVIR